MGSTVCPQSKHKYRPQCPKRTVYGDFSCTDRSRASPVSRRKNDVNCATISDVPFESPVPDFLSLSIEGIWKGLRWEIDVLRAWVSGPRIKHTAKISREGTVCTRDKVTLSPGSLWNDTIDASHLYTHTHTHIHTRQPTITVLKRESAQKRRMVGGHRPTPPHPSATALEPLFRQNPVTSPLHTPHRRCRIPPSALSPCHRPDRWSGYWSNSSHPPRPLHPSPEETKGWRSQERRLNTGSRDGAAARVGMGGPKCFHTAELCSKCLGLGRAEAFQSFECTFMIQTRRRQVVWRAHKISSGCVCSDIMDSKHCRRRWYGYWQTEHHQNKQLFLSASWETSQIFRRINCLAKRNRRTWSHDKKKTLKSGKCTIYTQKKNMKKSFPKWKKTLSDKTYK